MTILEALIQLRDDIKLWCINNFNQKLNKDDIISSTTDLTAGSSALETGKLYIVYE